MENQILYEDAHIIIVIKPPKVPSQGDKTGDKDMVTLIREYLQMKYPQAKNPYVGLLQRLDRPVGGIMVFAKTKLADGELSKQLQLKSIEKIYYGVVCGTPDHTKGMLIDYLLKNERLNKSQVVKKGTPNSKEAILEYEVVQTIDTTDYGALSLVKVNLKTGRHHQIRVQLSKAGYPLWGDTKYNQRFNKQKEWTQIALWAAGLSLSHPITKKHLSFQSLPKEQYPFSLFDFDATGPNP